MVAAIAWVALFASAESERRDAEEVTILGQVVDATGRTVEGAEIWITRTLRIADRGGDTVVLERLRSGADGGFVFRVEDDRLPELVRRYLSFFALAPGHALGRGGVNPFIPPNGRPVVVALPDEFSGSIRVTTPEGKPLAGARVRPLIALPERAHLPREIAERVAATTDAAGVARFTAVEAEEVHHVEVESAGFGRQTWSLGDHGAAPSIAVGAVGTLRGRLRAPEGFATGGLRVEVRVAAQDPDDARILRQATSVATTGADGSFEVGPLLAGGVTIRLECDESFPFQAAVPGKLGPGATRELEFECEPAFELIGRVVADDDGAPVAGAVVALEGVPTAEQESAADGSFRFWVPRRIPSGVAVRDAPRPFLSSRRAPEFRDVAPPAEGRRADPVELRLPRGRTISGRVRTAAGEPAAGAWVKLSAPEESLNPVSFVWPTGTICRADGSFEIAGLEPGTSWKIDVARGDEALAQPRVVAADDSDPLEFTLALVGLSAPVCEVVDERGAPIEGASVSLRSRHLDKQYGQISERGVDEQGTASRLRPTGSDGRCAFARRVEPDHEYRWFASAQGRASAWSDWFTPPAQGASHVRLVLRPLASARGRVTDRNGVPLAGARVFQSGDGPRRTETRADAQGRFELPGFSGGPAFVFVDGQGLRTRGFAITAPAEGLELRLARSDEPPCRLLSALPPPLALAERRALAEELLAPRIAAARAHPEDGFHHRILESWVLAAPERGLAAIDEGLFPDPWFRDYARRPLAKELLDLDLDDGLAVVQSMETAQFRARGFLDAVERRPDLPPDRRRALLYEALACARQITSPGMRVVYLAQIAEQFTERDDPELGHRILAGASPDAGALGSDDWEEYARGAFAEELASFDLARALALCDTIRDEHECDRHRGNIAHELAGRDPASAERVLRQLRQAFQRDLIARRVCYRMAPLDHERAATIAQRIGEPPSRAQAHLLMARSLAATDPAAAHAELRLGFDQLEALSREGEVLTNYDRCAAGVALAHLPTVELVAPDLVDELLWRALSWRRAPDPAPAWTFASWVCQRDGSIALALARYDREAAAHLLARLEPKLPELLASSDEEASLALFAWLAIEPATALRWFAQTPALREGESERTEKGFRAARLLGMLLRSGEEFWDSALESCLGLWRVDSED